MPYETLFFKYIYIIIYIIINIIIYIIIYIIKNICKLSILVVQRVQERRWVGWKWRVGGLEGRVEGSAGGGWGDGGIWDRRDQLGEELRRMHILSSNVLTLEK